MVRIVGWVLASGLVHLVVFAIAMTGVVPVEWRDVQPEPVPIEIVTEPIEPPPIPIEPEVDPVEPPEPEVVEDPVVPVEPRDPVAPRDDRPTPTPESVEPSGDGTSGPGAVIAPGPMVDVPQVEGGGPPRETDEERRARLGALVDPSRVARSGFDFGPGPSQRGGPAGLASRGIGGRAPTEAEIEESLSSGLRAEAMTKRHLDREPFRLQRRADGTQVWSGPRLTGIINPDGTVQFEDRPNVQTNGFSASGTFDMTEAIMGASGQDPLRAEREYFMRQTEEVRARLEAAHARAQMAQANTRLPGRLEGIWGAVRRSEAARRARIFAVWDEMADDETGREARAIVLRWIRERIPFGTDHAYTEDELRRFNAARESREPFAPYE